jgi:hypothetical protein
MILAILAAQSLGYPQEENQNRPESLFRSFPLDTECNFKIA